jgi:hypothetical protein
MVMYCAKQSSGTGPMIFVDGWRLAKVLGYLGVLSVANVLLMCC